ncbi:MAG: S-layer protein [Candidatus Micrarchaeota archaeon]
MRSANIKRISAVAAGAAMLGAAFAGAVTVDEAGLSNFAFFSGSGEPNVKIVVGSTAAPSDAVAAANIAAMIGNMAYTSKSIEVDTSGLTCEGGTTSGTGIKTVKLEVTTPGVNPNLAYAFQSYLYDNIDQFSDSTRTNVDAEPSYTGDPSNTSDAKVITQDNTNVLKLSNNGAVSNSKNLAIKEEQKVFFFSKAQYIDSDNSVQTRKTRIMYQVKFDNPIPACLNINKNYIDCEAANGLVENRVNIDFLGGKWVISDFTINSSRAFGSVNLAKEASYNEFMKIGDEIVAPNGVKIKLVDISGVPTGSNYQPPVQFDIFDANGNKIDTATLQESGTSEYDDNGVVVKLYKAFTGLGSSNYAKVAIWADKISLSNLAKITSSSIPTGSNWYSALQSQNYSSSEGLARINLYNTVDSYDLKPGEAVELLPGISGYKVNFLGYGNGADGNALETNAWDTLKFTIEKSTDKVVAANGTTVNGDWIVIQSTRTNAFQSSSLGISSDRVIFLAHGYTAGSAVGLNDQKNGSIFIQNTSGIWVNTTAGVSTTAVSQSGVCFDATNNYTVHAGVTYYYSSTESANITFHNAIGQNATAYNIALPLAGHGCVDLPGVETPTAGLNLIGSDTVKSDWVFHVPHYITDTAGTIALATSYTNASTFAATSTTNDIAFIYDASNKQWSNDGSSTTADQVYYRSAFLTNWTAGDKDGFWTWHGDKFDDISTDQVVLKYSDKILHAKYTLTAGGTEATSNSASADYKIGDEALNSDGYKVIVKDIASGTATEGGEVTGTPVLSEDTAFVVTELNTKMTPLVVFDRNADTTQPLIVVGGPLVNSVANSVLGANGVTSGSEAFVKVTDSQWIFVAGYTAGETTDAANSLIAWLNSNRASITG